MSWHDTHFNPLDRQPRRRGWIEIAACIALIMLGYLLGQAWHCVRYLMQRRS